MFSLKNLARKELIKFKDIDLGAHLRPRATSLYVRHR